MSLFPYRGHMPVVHPSGYVAPTASIIGAVTVGEESSVWFGAAIRGDVMPIHVGARTSIQDNAVVHATHDWQETRIGDDCTVGHGVILHGCHIHDRVLVGMGTIVLDAAEIGEDVILGAGSLVTARTRIPPGVMAFGRPAKPVRDLTDAERASIGEAAAHYQKLVRDYRGGA